VPSLAAWLDEDPLAKRRYAGDALHVNPRSTTTKPAPGGDEAGNASIALVKQNLSYDAYEAVVGIDVKALGLRERATG
jgi:hypothetical protein